MTKPTTVSKSKTHQDVEFWDEIHFTDIDAISLNGIFPRQNFSKYISLQRSDYKKLFHHIIKKKLEENSKKNISNFDFEKGK